MATVLYYNLPYLKRIKQLNAIVASLRVFDMPQVFDGTHKSTPYGQLDGESGLIRPWILGWVTTVVGIRF